MRKLNSASPLALLAGRVDEAGEYLSPNIAFATAIYTAAVFKLNTNGKGVQIGLNHVTGTLAWGATSTVGDVGYLCKVPQGATIFDMWEYHTTGATTQALDFGFLRGIAAGGGGNTSVLIHAGAQATMNRTGATNAALLPVTISVSDTDPKRYAEFVCTVVSGTTTTSLKVRFGIAYNCTGELSNFQG